MGRSHPRGACVHWAGGNVCLVDGQARGAPGSDGVGTTSQALTLGAIMELGMPQFYECGICGQYHSVDWNGDCRDDLARFNADWLDEEYGWNGWTEVDMPDS